MIAIFNCSKNTSGLTNSQQGRRPGRAVPEAMLNELIKVGVVIEEAGKFQLAQTADFAELEMELDMEL